MQIEKMTHCGELMCTTKVKLQDLHKVVIYTNLFKEKVNKNTTVELVGKKDNVKEKLILIESGDETIVKFKYRCEHIDKVETSVNSILQIVNYAECKYL